MCLDDIIREASKLSDQQMREALAMARGMEAANRITQERGA